MIAFDFMYMNPTTIAEANEAFNAVRSQGEKPMFYAGGTEIITFARVNQLHMDAVIDIKGIAECRVLELREKELVIGSAVSLNRITNSTYFPLLGDTVKKIADHTSRNKITIGGNINSDLIYKESVLPLLLVDAKVKISSGGKEEVIPLKTIFNKEMKLDEGAFLLQIIVDASCLDLPYSTIKRTKISKVGYPVVSIAAIVKEHQIRVAFSGVCNFPFRSLEVENSLNDSTLSVIERIDQAIECLPSEVVDDIQGTAAYRTFVLRNVLRDTMEELGMME